MKSTSQIINDLVDRSITDLLIFHLNEVAVTKSPLSPRAQIVYYTMVEKLRSIYGDEAEDMVRTLIKAAPKRGVPKNG